MSLEGEEKTIRRQKSISDNFVWDSLDTSSLTGLVALPSGLEIRLGLLDTGARNPAKELFWRQAEKLSGKIIPLGSDSPSNFEFMAKLWEKHLTRGNLMERLKKRLPKLDVAITNPGYFRRYNDTFFWEGLKRLGPHAPDGSYGELEFEFRGILVAMRWTHSGDGTVATEVKTSGRKDSFLVVVECFHPCSDKEFQIGSEMIPLKSNKNMASIAFSVTPKLSFSLNEFPQNIHKEIGKGKRKADCGKFHFFVFAPVSPLYFAASPDSGKDLTSIVRKTWALLDKTRINYEKKCFSLASDSDFGGCAEACVRAIAWNTIYDFEKKRTFVPVSRRWAKAWGGWVLYPWDTFFAAMMVARESADRAKDIVRAMLDQATDGGMLQNYTSPFQNTPDRSQPPVGSYVVLKTFFDDFEFLREAYPKLKRWHEWWMPNRDGNRDGLLEWGAGPDGNDPCRASLQGARYESGLDNSPMYDDVEFDEKSHCMKLADVGLNSLYALDAWSLSKIAEKIGTDADREKFFNEYLEMKDRINDELWNDEKGIYLNRDWGGRFSHRLSPTLFYPMLAGIPSKQQAKRMVAEHLLNESEFWGDFVLPSIARNDPAFRDNNYWRGRIWGPMNFLVAEGLKRYGFYRESCGIAKRSARLFQREWRKECHIHENYNSSNGEGDDVLNSEPVYTWGALLAFLGVQEIADYEPWAGLRFGSLFVEDEVFLKNCRLGSVSWDVEKSKEVTRIKNENEESIVIEGKALTNSFVAGKDEISFVLDRDGSTSLQLQALTPKIKVTIHDKKSNKTIETTTDSEGSLHLEI
ncbi:MAG: trehalase family glycosidase [bacterium]